MGLKIGFSSSSYDRQQRRCNYCYSPVRDVIKEVVRPIYIKNPNPDPKNYKIKGTITYQKKKGAGNFLIVRINYPDCTNFEGNKILVYEDTTIRDLQKQGGIDPHFTNNTKFKAPIARFIPGIKGLFMAGLFCKMMQNKRNLKSLS